VQMSEIAGGSTLQNLWEESVFREIPCSFPC
jgi:hypothetical protein